jgi:putative transposase
MIDYFRRKRFYHYNTPGHAHELTFWCVRHTRLFDDALARELFLQELSRARVAYKFKLFAYVIMPTHVHMVIGPSEPKYDIMRIRNGIKGCFARRYRSALRVQAEGKNGDDPVFSFWEQGGGEDRNLWDAGAIVDSIHYIEANPVRSLLADAPDEWPASSAHARRHGTGMVPDAFGKSLSATPSPRQRLAGIPLEV